MVACGSRPWRCRFLDHRPGRGAHRAGTGSPIDTAYPDTSGLNDVASATTEPEDATTTAAPSGTGFVTEMPRTTVRPGGTRTRCGIAAAPFSSSRRICTTAGVAPGFARDIFQ